MIGTCPIKLATFYHLLRTKKNLTMQQEPGICFQKFCTICILFFCILGIAKFYQSETYKKILKLL